MYRLSIKNFGTPRVGRGAVPVIHLDINCLESLAVTRVGASEDEEAIRPEGGSSTSVSASFVAFCWSRFVSHDTFADLAACIQGIWWGLQLERPLILP